MFLYTLVVSGSDGYYDAFSAFTWWGIVDLLASHHFAGRMWGGVDDVDPEGAGVCGCILVEYMRWTASGAGRDSVEGGVNATGRGGRLIDVAEGGRKERVVFKFDGTFLEGVRRKSNEMSKSDGLSVVDDLDVVWEMNMVSVCSFVGRTPRLFWQ